MLEKIDDKKAYFSISEVCRETELEQHVLRYWETEFSQLKPKKNRAGNRAYRLKDIQLIKFIKQLLYDEHFTIVGAKKRISESREHANDPDSTEQNLTNNTSKSLPVPLIRRELEAILKILEK